MGSFVFTVVNYLVIEICQSIYSFYPCNLMAAMITGTWIPWKFYRHVAKSVASSGLRFCLVSLIFFLVISVHLEGPGYRSELCEKTLKKLNRKNVTLFSFPVTSCMTKKIMMTSLYFSTVFQLEIPVISTGLSNQPNAEEVQPLFWEHSVIVATLLETWLFKLACAPHPMGT